MQARTQAATAAVFIVSGALRLPRETTGLFKVDGELVVQSSVAIDDAIVAGVPTDTPPRDPALPFDFQAPDSSFPSPPTFGG